jgi:hypothetical protein
MGVTSTIPASGMSFSRSSHSAAERSVSSQHLRRMPRKPIGSKDHTNSTIVITNICLE